MELKWMAVGALALIPCAAMAQAKTSDSSAARRDTSKYGKSAEARRDTTQQGKSASQQTTTSTSTGEVSSNPGTNVTQAMIAAQGDANIIGSPAWWKNHGTADGKPPIQRSGTSH